MLPYFVEEYKRAISRPYKSKSKRVAAKATVAKAVATVGILPTFTVYPTN